MFTDTKYHIQESDGYRYIQEGDAEGRPTLVLLHGMFGGLSNFEYLLDNLRGHYHIVVPEIPLYDLKHSQLNISYLADWLDEFLDILDLKPVVLLGNSMGGHIALEYALHHTREVESMILTGSSGLFENEFGSTMPRRGDREYIRERAELVFYDPAMVTEALVDEILEVVNSKGKLLKLLRLARATHKYNMESLLSDIDIPTLLVWGEDDKVTPPEVAWAFESGLPDAKLEWIERCGHAPMMERPHSFLSILKKFLGAYQPQ